MLGGEALGRLALGEIFVGEINATVFAGSGTFEAVGEALVPTTFAAAGIGAFAAQPAGSSATLTAGGSGAFNPRMVGLFTPIPGQEPPLFDQPSAAVAFLVKFSFASAEKKIWTGFGKLITLDGQEWDGLGEIVQLDGLTSAFGPQAPPGRIMASGVSADLITLARSETSEFVNRPLSIYLQGFNGRKVFGLPVPLALRIMTNMEVTRDAGTRTIAVNHESPYAGRNRPAAAWYTDRDQQKRFPGDTFCDQTPFLLFKREVWPTY